MGVSVIRIGMEKMGKETRRMLCWLLAICLSAAAGLGILLFYMTNDFQKIIVEHDYGTAGYLVNHSDSNVQLHLRKTKRNLTWRPEGRHLRKRATMKIRIPGWFLLLPLTGSVPRSGSEV